MKKIYLSIITISLLSSSANAQTLKRMADRAKQKVEQKVNQKVEKKIDDVFDGKPKDKKSDTPTSTSTNNKKETGNNQKDNVENNADEKKGPSFKSYSKFDFIPGEKVIVSENFSDVEIGDFPAKWNTNASAEVVKIDGVDGKWMMINQSGVFYPEFISALPDNFTLEFDVYANPGFNYYSTALGIIIAQRTDNTKIWNIKRYGSGIHGIVLGLKPIDASSSRGEYDIVTYNKGEHNINNHGSNENFFASKTEAAKAKVSIWKQQQRLRVYLNETKIIDLPRAFEANSTYDHIAFSTQNFHNNENEYYISNLRLAVGNPDTRNRLINEGKFVTSGINFQTNSDVINPNSYGILKNIATVLSENPTVKIKIVGHTDSDGDDKSNQTLSEKRAASVKKVLESEFNIAGDRIVTEGKGESEPIDKNDNPIGKANNRRVEFIKL